MGIYRQPLTHDQRKTRDAMFQEPPLKEVSWSKIRDLLGALEDAEVEETNDVLSVLVRSGEFRRNGRFRHPHREKHASSSSLRDVRSFLETVEIERTGR